MSSSLRRSALALATLMPTVAGQLLYKDTPAVTAAEEGFAKSVSPGTYSAVSVKFEAFSDGECKTPVTDDDKKTVPLYGLLSGCASVKIDDESVVKNTLSTQFSGTVKTPFLGGMCQKTEVLTILTYTPYIVLFNEDKCDLKAGPQFRQATGTTGTANSGCIKMTTLSTMVTGAETTQSIKYTCSAAGLAVSAFTVVFAWLLM